MNKKNLLLLFGIFVFLAAAFISINRFLGSNIAQMVYPLVIHLPLIILLTWIYQKNPVMTILSVTSAYLCCQISKWIGLVAQSIFQAEWVYYGTRIVITVLSLLLIMFFFANAFSRLTEKDTKTLGFFSIIPLTYYIFDYATGVYSSLIYSGSEVVVEFLGFVLCIVYLLFILVYFQQYEKTAEAEQLNRMLAMQQSTAEKQLETIRQSDHAISLIRHDMRHFLLNISSMISNGEADEAQSYIQEILDNVDATAIRKYTNHHIVNMILSSYESRMAADEIEFTYDLKISNELRLSDVELTSLLSNALENAVKAVRELPPKERKISLEMKETAGKLLLSLKNTYLTAPKLVDGVPISAEKDHGLGTQSICQVTERLHGNWQYSVKDGWFVLRLII